MLPETANAPGTITVKSGAFANMGMIPDKHSEYFKGGSPELSWTGVPTNAKSLVLMMEDPDANVKPVTHWIVANIAPEYVGFAGKRDEGYGDGERRDAGRERDR